MVESLRSPRRGSARRWVPGVLLCLVVQGFVACTAKGPTSYQWAVSTDDEEMCWVWQDRTGDWVDGCFDALEVKIDQEIEAGDCTVATSRVESGVVVEVRLADDSSCRGIPSDASTSVPSGTRPAGASD